MKWIRRVVIFAVVFVVVLWGGLNIALATSLGPKLLNLSPNDAQFAYGKARMWVPWQIQVEDFTMFVQDPGLQMRITAQKAKAKFHPLALLGLGISLSDIDGDEVTFRMRTRVQKGELGEAQLAALPPIEAFESPIREGAPVFPEKLPFIDLKRLNVTNVREIWVNEYRYQGKVDLKGGFELQPLAHIKLEQTDIYIEPGTVAFGGKKPLKIEKSAIHASTGRIFFETADIESLEKLNVVVKLQAEVLGARFLNAYLRDVPDVRIIDGAGTLKVDVEIKDGVVGSASRFQLITDQLLVRVPYMDVVGQAEISGQVDGERPAIRVAMKNVGLEQRSTKSRVLQGAQFKLAALLSSCDLTKEQYLDLALNLGNAKAPDLTFLNEYIPEGAGIRIFGGSGVVGGNVNMSTKGNHLKGALDIDAKQLAIKNRSALVTGRASIHGVVPDVNLKTGAMDISGSNFRLDDVEVATPTRRDKGYWLALKAPKGKLSGKGEWDSSLELSMSNVQPALTVVTSVFQLPELLAAIINIPDIKVTTDLNVAGTKVYLRHIKLTSGGALSAEGNVILQEVGQKKEDRHLQPWGVALVTYKPLVVGLDLQGEKVKPIIGDPEKWYRANFTGGQ